MERNKDQAGLDVSELRRSPDRASTRGNLDYLPLLDAELARVVLRDLDEGVGGRGIERLQLIASSHEASRSFPPLRIKGRLSRSGLAFASQP